MSDTRHMLGLGDDPDADSQPFMACPHCGAEMDWEDCDQCGGEGVYDAYEIDPMWYEPGDTETCELCGGSRGFWWCANMQCPVKAVTPGVAAGGLRDGAT